MGSDLSKAGLKRFDHGVIFFRDLDKAMQIYRDVLGFDVGFGGKHDNGITHNAIVRFGLDYIELISFIDWDKGISSTEVESGFVDFIGTRQAFPWAYAMAPEEMEKFAGRVKSAGLEAIGPISENRTRPDGNVLEWEVLLPYPSFWRRWPLPFIINWTTPDEQRLSWDKPGKHPNGVLSILGISVGVKDLEAARKRFEDGFGCVPVDQGDVPELNAQRIRYHVGESFIDLLTPGGDGPVSEAINDLGEGLIQITLAVEDLKKFQEAIDKNKVNPVDAPEVPGGLLIDDVSTFGIRMVLVEKKS